MSKMYKTATAIVTNMISFIQEYGFVLNGARAYYTNRRYSFHFIYVYFDNIKDILAYNNNFLLLVLHMILQPASSFKCYDL